MLQRVAACCSVLQCVVFGCLNELFLDHLVCCSVLQCAAACCSMLQCVTACCSVLRLVALTNRSLIVYCVAVCCSVLRRVEFGCVNELFWII